MGLAIACLDACRGASASGPPPLLGPLVAQDVIDASIVSDGGGATDADLPFDAGILIH
jgi:hypothetical protein